MHNDFEKFLWSSLMKKILFLFILSTQIFSAEIIETHSVILKNSAYLDSKNVILECKNEKGKTSWELTLSEDGYNHLNQVNLEIQKEVKLSQFECANFDLELIKDKINIVVSVKKETTVDGTKTKSKSFELILTPSEYKNLKKKS